MKGDDYDLKEMADMYSEKKVYEGLFIITINLHLRKRLFFLPATSHQARRFARLCRVQGSTPGTLTERCQSPYEPKPLRGSNSPTMGSFATAI